MPSVQRLISLPPGMAPRFEELTGRRFPEWMASSDPADGVGSGGGTAWLLAEAWKRENSNLSFQDWISRGRRLVIHSGGKSRRLPEFAPQGKVFMPVPPRQERGAKVLTWLLDELVEFGDDVLDRSATRIKVLILAGDVLFRDMRIGLPGADLAVAGLPSTLEEASRHGVFIVDQQKTLKDMLQKPSVSEIPEDWLLDIGIWGLSAKAVMTLMVQSGWNGFEFAGGQPKFYDLYGEFGPAARSLGLVAKVEPVEGQFVHLGTTQQFQDFWGRTDSPLASLAGLPEPDHEAFFAAQRAKTKAWVEGMTTIRRSLCDLSQVRELGLSGSQVVPDYAQHMLRGDREAAFAALEQTIIDEERIRKTIPSRGKGKVIAQAPLRLDLAGGWTDTPPYCLHHSAAVVNLAVEWDDLSPSVATIEPIKGDDIEVVSVDRKQAVTLREGEPFAGRFREPGCPTIGLAALHLCGVTPNAFPGGFRLTMESRAPEGSGLGASSILAATVLGALNVYLRLDWSNEELVWRTLCLEQLIGSHGGWQDQAGGIYPGLKFLHSRASTNLSVKVEPLDPYLLENQPSLLLYDTGIQRRAFNVLGDIVEGMFLNDHARLRKLRQIGAHAMVMRTAIGAGRFDEFGYALRRSWQLNQELDSGTNPPAIQRLLAEADDLMLGGKLLGAGGGGFFLLAAKDQPAAHRIKRMWQDANPAGRFINWRIASKGLTVRLIG